MWPEGELSRTTRDSASRVNRMVRDRASSIRVTAPNRSTCITVVLPRGSVIRARTVSAMGALAGVCAVLVYGTPTCCQGAWLSVGDTVPAQKIGTDGEVLSVRFRDSPS